MEDTGDDRVAQFRRRFARLNDPTDYDTFKNLAVDAAELVADAPRVVAEIAEEIALSSDPYVRLAQWLMIDKLCKQDDVFGVALQKRIVDLIQAAPVPREAGPIWDGFQQVLESLKHTIDAPLIALAQAKLAAELSAQQRAQGGRTLPLVSLMPLHGRGGRSDDHTTAGSPMTSSGALITHNAIAARSIGPFQTAVANNNRPAAGRDRLQVKTRDSHAAMKMASAYAPAAPQEIALPMPIADADAPQGFMQALPEGHVEAFVEERRKRMRDVMERERVDREAREAGETIVGSAGASKKDVKLAADLDFSDVRMPAELPRDEYGVKMCNYPEGVRFLRECVRQCGGAVELEVLSRRVSQMADTDAVAALGDLRFFLKVHAPTFALSQEGAPPRWVVRIVGDPQVDNDRNVDPSQPRCWESYKCELCTTVVTPGRNIARHRNCRRCVAMQIAIGLKGGITGPISELAFAASFIDRNRWDFDDDDLLWFARAIEASGEVRRFKLATARTFAPVLKGIRAVRDRWLSERGAKTFDELRVYPEDRARCAFFETLGANFNRLPIPWIETGDICDMCRRFSTGVKRPFNAPPRPGDPRIRVDSEFCGMMMCTSESDSEDDPLESEDEFSDEEDVGFEIAPPVSITETIMVAGIDRDSRKLMYKLRTAPPMVLQKVIAGGGQQTLEGAYNDEFQLGAPKGADQLPGWGGAAPSVAPPPPLPRMHQHSQGGDDDANRTKRTRF